MKKVVMKLDIYDDASRTEASRIISSFSGIRSISMDKINKVITLIGDIDPEKISEKLSQLGSADILTVVTAEEPES